jgi:hypothetical protein
LRHVFDPRYIDFKLEFQSCSFAVNVNVLSHYLNSMINSGCNQLEVQNVNQNDFEKILISLRAAEISRMRIQDLDLIFLESSFIFNMTDPFPSYIFFTYDEANVSYHIQDVIIFFLIIL